jgi:uncharacterized membrane protein
MSGRRSKENRQPETSDTLQQRQPGVVQLQAASFSGPLPLPSLLAQYNDIIPNGAERIMAMAERQSAHRERLEARVVDGNVANQTRGSYFAFVIALVALVGGFFLIHEGRSSEGLAAIITSVSGLVGVFVYAKVEQRRERTEKIEALQQRRSQR